MSHFSLSLSAGGPVLDAFVSVSPQRQEALAKAGLPIPNPVQIRALVDTGASCTCVDPKVLKALGLEPTGTIPVHTPSTEDKKPHEANQFDVIIMIPGFPGSTPFLSGTIPVVEAQLEHQGIKALIGRDILEGCLLVYEGRAKFFSLAF